MLLKTKKSEKLKFTLNNNDWQTINIYLTRNLKKKVKFAQLMIIENKTQQLRLAQMHESLDQQQAWPLLASPCSIFQTWKITRQFY